MPSTLATPRPHYGQARAALATTRLQTLQGIALFVSAILATALIEGIL